MWTKEQIIAKQLELEDKNAEKFSFSKARYQTCKQCENFIKIVRACKVCHCFMPGKVLIKAANCPLDKWGPVNEK